MYFASCPRTWGREIPEADSWRAAPRAGQCQRCRWVAAGFQAKGGNLVFLVSDLQSEVVQGSPEDRRRGAAAAAHGRLAGQTPTALERVRQAAAAVVAGQVLCCV